MTGFNFQGRHQKPRVLQQTLTHVLVWLMIINLPVLSTKGPALWSADYLLLMIPPIASALVFYANFLVLIPRLFFTRRMVRFVFSNLMLYALMILSVVGFGNWMIQTHSMEMRVPPVDLELIVRFAIALTGTTSICVSIKIAGQWFRSEEQRKDLEQEHLKSELANLKNQLNPHFFFNTLNTIYGLVVTDQEKAQQAVHLLSKLMRYLLYDSNEKFVSLDKELSFLHSYIELMQLRAGDHLEVNYQFPSQPPPYRIAPLLFIAQVENAFKHGSSPDQASEITILLEINQGQEISFTVKNKDFAKTDTDRSGSGIGIENLKKRLILLYPDHHTFTVQTYNGFYESTLILQL